MATQGAADQPLANAAGTGRQADMQVEAEADAGRQQQRAEQPGIGLAQLLPAQRDQRPGREQQGQPAPVHRRGLVRARLAAAEQVLERRRHQQHHQQQAQALRCGDAAEHRAVALPEVDHLAGAAGHAGEERGGAVLAAAAHEGDRQYAGKRGGHGAEDDDRAVRQHLLDHCRGEVQADADADDPLPALACPRHFGQRQVGQAAHQHHRQQRADHPRQRPADQACQPAAKGADQRRRPVQPPGDALRHRPALSRDGSRGGARRGPAATAASPPPGPRSPG